MIRRIDDEFEDKSREYRSVENTEVLRIQNTENYQKDEVSRVFPLWRFETIKSYKQDRYI